MVTMNPDLAKERAAASFNVEHLVHFLDRGEEHTKRRRDIQQRALNERVGMHTII